jgi:hypothetical protein
MPLKNMSKIEEIVDINKYHFYYHIS